MIGTRVLDAYETVLQRHNIAAIEDTRHYQLLLQLSLMPNHDWREKLSAFRSLHLEGAARLRSPSSSCAAPPPRAILSAALVERRGRGPGESPRMTLPPERGGERCLGLAGSRRTKMRTTRAADVSNAWGCELAGQGPMLIAQRVLQGWGFERGRWPSIERRSLPRPGAGGASWTSLLPGSPPPPSPSALTPSPPPPRPPPPRAHARSLAAAERHGPIQ